MTWHVDNHDMTQSQADPRSSHNPRHSQVIFLICGTLRVSKVIRFLSHPVITGFTTGAAMFIGFSQLRLCFGIKVRLLPVNPNRQIEPTIT